VELGGANSCFLERIAREVRPEPITSSIEPVRLDCSVACSEDSRLVRTSRAIRSRKQLLAPPSSTRQPPAPGA